MQQRPEFVQPDTTVLPLTLIDRYIAREILKIFIAIILILLLVLVGASFVKLLQLAAEGDIANEVLFTLLGLEILRLVGQLIPPAFFFSVLFVLGRMYRDNEMTVLATSGIGPGRIYRLVLLIALPVALVTTWLSVSLYPSISYLSNRIKIEQRDNVLVAAIDAGRFIESSRGDVVLYAESRGESGGFLEHLFVQHRESGKLAIVTAVTGEHRKDEESGLRVVTLKDGIRYEARNLEQAMTVLEFGEYDMWINPASTEDLARKYGTWPTRALLKAEALGARSELQRRLAFPVSAIAFAILAVPLSRSMPRQGVSGRVVVAVVIYFIASALNQMAATWMVKEVTPAWMGTWWVLVLMFVVAFLLAWPDFRHRWRRPGGEA